MNRRVYDVFELKKGNKGLPRRRNLLLGDDDDCDGWCVLAFTICLDYSERFSKDGVYNM